MALFTAESAKIAAAKSHQPESARFLPKPAKPVEAKTAEIIAKPADEYLERRIKVTRKQIRFLDDQLEACEEAKDLKAIADALARLQEIERQLSGRPLPGTLRPAKTIDRSRMTGLYSDPTPQPVVESK